MENCVTGMMKMALGQRAKRYCHLGANMLPDLKSVRDAVHQQVRGRFLAKYRTLGPVISQCPVYMIHEGNPKGDGAYASTDWITVSSIIEIKNAEVEQMTIEDWDKKFSAVAEDIVKQQEQHAFKVVGEVCERTGNVLKLEGKPFDREQYLKALEMVEIPFDRGNRPILPQMYNSSKENVDRANAELEAASRDSEFVNRFKALMAKKLGEYRDREADRKLVD